MLPYEHPDSQGTWDLDRYWIRTELQSDVPFTLEFEYVLYNSANKKQSNDDIKLIWFQEDIDLIWKTQTTSSSSNEF